MTTIVIAAIVFGVPPPLPYWRGVVACLVGFNVASHLRWSEQQEVTNSELFLSLLVDVISLTAQLYLSGGTNNPFAFLYLLQVILSAVLLRGWATWIIVLATSVCLAGLALFAKPLPLQLDHSRGIFSLYVQGLLLCFALDAALLVFFIRRITNNLRAGDAKLAALRQRAAEEEHIVRMGLRASGAAHELGTPLAPLSVILGDWRRMPAVSKNPDLLDDITEMQTQLQRCKSIVSGILLSAGEARGESTVRTTIHTFLDQLITEWRASRPVASFDYYNRIGEDLPVVFDSALKQMICNVLDNALEASPEWLSFVATREDEMLVMSVSDSGPGFAPEILAQFGQPDNSSQGRPGGGLGLFLAVNVARTLGGTVEARNRPQGGASVQMRLPLAALVLEEESADAE